MIYILVRNSLRVPKFSTPNWVFWLRGEAVLIPKDIMVGIMFGRAKTIYYMINVFSTFIRRRYHLQYSKFRSSKHQNSSFRNGRMLNDYYEHQTKNYHDACLLVVIMAISGVVTDDDMDVMADLWTLSQYKKTFLGMGIPIIRSSLW